MTTPPLDRLFAPGRLAALSAAGRAAVQALRLIVHARQRDADPLPRLAASHGGVPTAQALHRLALLIGAVWPDRVQLAPPCCGMLTPDEALIGAMAGHAAAGDRQAFDRDASDLLSAAARDQLWRALAAAQVQPLHRAPPPRG